ncbi:hypothetical protein CSIM01_06060 [Colletotrichum simmondsii]|uniref:Azaphilone pigments biosynthesis cluster protein L N-terminal domain-containing protein n=1 Tax=Colletotrichum simmondsii TaxID=703756 RepID=A0A135SSM6_9PEZI|nr:hypothetical protein CSIM01_06060 [Colletotrichum simmondsii]
MDPLSISSGVAGLVSLGLTVCKGLHIFCQDYRTRDVDIRHLKEHSKRLDSFLQLIQSRLKEGQLDSTLSVALQDCFRASQQYIQEFENLAKKQTRSGRLKGLKEFGKDAARHLQYPLQKAKFDRAKAEMLGFHSTLTNYLLLINYDLTNDLRKTTVLESAKLISYMVSEGEKTETQISTLLPSLERALDARLTGLGKSLVASFRLNLGSACDLEEVPPRPSLKDKVGNHRVPFPSQSSGECQNNIAGSSMSMHEGRAGITVSMEPPHLDTDQCRQKGPISKYAPSYAITQGFGCSCRASTLLKQRHHSLRQPVHDSHCELLFMNPNRRIIEVTLKLFSTLFSWKLELQYSKQIRFRNVQIHPTMTSRSLVPDDAPSFLVVNELVRRTRDNISEEALQDAVASALKDLRCLFRNGKAWPSDLNSFDQTLLHRASNARGRMWSDRMSQIWVQFMKELVVMGVPLNETGRLGSALNWFLHIWRVKRARFTNYTPEDLPAGSFAIARGLLELGALSISPEVKHKTFVSGNILSIPDIYQNFPGYVDKGFDHGALSCALLQKSEPAIRSILLVSSDSVADQGYLGYTPLHVAVHWPRGLELLFELAENACLKIINAEDATGLSAIHSAILLHKADSVKLLLDQGANIDLENTATFFRHPDAPGGYVQSQEVIDLLCDELAARRRQMLVFARRNLNEKNTAPRRESLQALQDTLLFIGWPLDWEAYQEVTGPVKHFKLWVIVQKAPFSRGLCQTLLEIVATAIAQNKAVVQLQHLPNHGERKTVVPETIGSIDVKTIYDPVWMTDPSEVAEIQEEDQHLATTLEQLVEEFEVRLNEPSLALEDFWLYWRTRMKEVKEAKEEIGCEDIRAIREIGVNLE